MTNGYVTNEQLLEQLNWRYAVKRFDASRKISDQDWTTLERALLLAPSSYGLQPWKFYVVTDEVVRKELRAHSYDQPQIEECSHLVVISALKDAGAADIERYLDRIIEVRKTPREELEVLREMMYGSQKAARESGSLNDWSARQCFIALGFLLSAAAMLGIDACPMEGFEAEKYDKSLGIEQDGYFSVVACALGYRDPEEDWLGKLEKVRYEPSEVFKRV
ncbi:MAG: NAD(P)H-dependent oxidoreductase [Acidobacteriota bacterium]|nr:NAD(P)H-dependent oxidoreductase [Acidobacteriota bacterium]MDH3529422.1 NAD(P)H-dependent oxidoreductase [Acidobacteriota bacterium]